MTKIKLFSGIEKPYTFTVYAVLTPKHEDRTVFENDRTNIQYGVLFRLFLLSPKRSHAWFMISLLSRSETKALSSRSTLRLFIGSFFLFWTLNPRSQGTMPTGMIRVHNSEQLDYPREEGRWREASQFPRLDAWIICHLVMGSILHHEGDMTIYREKVSPFFGLLNNSAQDYSDSSFRQ